MKQIKLITLVLVNHLKLWIRISFFIFIQYNNQLSNSEEVKQ